MARYIYCILLGALLMLGITSFLNKDAQEFRTETGAVTHLQCYSELNQCDFEALSKEKRTVNNEGYTCKASNGILGTALSVRTIPPSKTLRSTPTALVIQILSSLNSQLPTENWAYSSFDTNLTKLSYRYYIYTLQRITI